MAHKIHWTQTPRGRKIMAANARGKKGMTVKAPSGKSLAKSELNDLARRGAQARLAELEREADKLRIFLGFTREHEDRQETQ